MASSDYLGRLQAATEVLHTLPVSAGMDLARRGAALRQAIDLGLPGLRDDAFRYMSLRDVRRATLLPSTTATAADIAGLSPLLPAALPGFERLVYVDGRLSAALCTASAVARAKAANAVQLPALPLQGQPGPWRFALLNEALGIEQGRLDIQDGDQLEVVFLNSRSAAAVYPRLAVNVAAGAHATLVERHAGGQAAALCSSLVQVDLAPAAHLVHYRVQAGASDALQFDALFAQLHDEADYQLFQLDIGGGAVRHGLQLQLSGRDARVDVQALALGRGAAVIDSCIDLHHAGRGSRSTQCLRAIANDQSGLSYNSRVEVGAGAAGSQSRQSLKGLLGGARAEINLRPQLEINTDDVQASHGATTGALDANMMFYLLSRGIDPATARQLLEWAFAEDVLSRIAVEPLRRQVEQAALASLDNAAAREAQS